ncbi:hypothetical protein AB1Y20_007681 [Prymnesium parvum]|uniref:tRNA/rRNA methyltransferase SpoU type domain-containing protein n=1 Tax=Prymnesium parvum TaxID=97485 RepID=A0AB34IYD2_PRYPA|mmetsp:Transcript_13995/g.34970  ORF Transcript_13995/g.34970 Transcript_13995/m.34970 type:complete len:292 (-) Transcript_13995:267-1142(-)
MDFDPSFDSFVIVRKNRDACIHWLLQLARHIEVHWTADTDDQRIARLTLLRDCFASLADHKHSDCRELSALVPRMMHRLDFDERHFLNLVLPIERRHSKGRHDHDFLVTSADATQPPAEDLRLPLVLVLDHLRSAFNVGAIFRTAECLGVCEMYLCGYTATPEDLQVQRTTMGAHEHMTWRWCRDTREAINALKASGLTIVALETVVGAPFAAQYSFPRSGCALLLGNERHGIAPELLAMCDAVVRLPSRGLKNSMNVAVALGMCGYEIVRQWTGGSVIEDANISMSSGIN